MFRESVGEPYAGSRHDILVKPLLIDDYDEGNLFPLPQIWPDLVKRASVDDRWVATIIAVVAAVDDLRQAEVAAACRTHCEGVPYGSWHHAIPRTVDGHILPSEQSPVRTL